MAAYILREGAPESVGMDPARIQRVRESLDSWVKRGDTPSHAALVARRGVIVLNEAFGVRHYNDTTPTLRPDSIFPLASGSKPLTASAVMCLVEDGLIGLNRPFVDYVPELDVPGVEGLADVKVADLLCHTSGIDDLAMGAFMTAAAKVQPDLPPASPGQHPAVNRFIRLAAGAPLSHPPGTAMVYSGLGFMFLGDIVRRVSGQPFWQFVKSRLFDPMGMHDSYFVLPPSLRQRRVYRAPGMPANTPGWMYGGIDSPQYDEVDSGSGGAASTTRDLAVFLQMLLNRGSYAGRRILSPASVAAVIRNQISPSIVCSMPQINPATGQRTDLVYRGSSYGYGWFVFGTGDRFKPNGALQSPSAFGHMGYACVYMWADPERELLGVYLFVAPRLERNMPLGNQDLFQNAVHAAIIE
jgi:CubicO group peptidase (beta-lactamase class C family)